MADRSTPSDGQSRADISRQSIYSLLARHRGDEWPELPDEEHARGTNKSAWSYGARDGIYSHHGGGRPDETTAAEIIKLLTQLQTSEPGAEHVKFEMTAMSGGGTLTAFETLYELLKERQTLSWLESFEQKLAASGLDPRKLYDTARGLARSSSHREAVKAGMAMMSLVSGIWDRETFLTLGSHDEFTLFAVVAVRRKTATDEGDTLLLELAKTAHGWGRIHAIERLDGSADPLVRDWLLREGYMNDVMHEYTALICARTVHLAGLLQDEGLDRAALRGAGDILASLLSGNEEAAAGMDAYEDGARACELWLRRMTRNAEAPGFLELEDFPRIALIHDKAKTEIDNPEGMDQHWFGKALQIRDLSRKLLSSPVWETLTGSAHESDSIGARALASRVRDRLKSLD